MTTSTIYRSLMFATVTVLLVLTNRAMSMDCGENETNNSDGCGSGDTTLTTDSSTPPAPSNSAPPAPPPVMPQPLAPGGGAGGTIGSLPTIMNALNALGIPPSLAAAGALLAMSGGNGPTVTVQAPYKLAVSTYSWIVNGEVIFGGNLYQVGPTLYFSLFELKLAAILYGGPILIIFNDMNGAPVAAVDVLKQY
ncbi:MAG: hypothetical protein ACKVS6_10660 [Planctomycetota bacterium]